MTDKPIPNDFQSILSAAQLLSAELRDEADDIDATRRLPASVVARLREAGAFRLTMPRTWGGPELTTLEQIAVIEEYARASASVGWCVNVGCDSGLYSAWLPESVSADLYGTLDIVQAGWVYPMGKAVAAPGGYRVTGHWSFGSGIEHSDWVSAGCWVFESEQDARTNQSSGEWRIMLGRPEEFDIVDNWYATGLRGTGSCDYTCTDLFIPTERSFSFLEPALRSEVLYAGNDALLRKMPGVPLGVARAVLDDALVVLESKMDRLFSTPYRDMPRIQSLVAMAEGRLAGARAFVHNSVSELWECLAEDRSPTRHVRANAWLARLNAFQTARWIARAMYDAIGGSAVYERGMPLDRHLRDTETMCQHVCGQTKGYELVGAMLLDPTGFSTQPFLNASPERTASLAVKS